MRKITAEAISAFVAGATFSKSNTIVSIVRGDVVLSLHGNPIARYPETFYNQLEICDGGWQTNTTKERLNGIPNVHVQQKKGVWYLNGMEWNGNWTKVV